ncbi:hypothetical protein bcgnr5390_61600 [Bacillus luti]|nr:hypothetical protein BC2903_31230 [Bacillus cereus]
MKKGILILISIIIAGVAAFFIFKSKEQTANTEPAETKPEKIENLEKLDTPIRPGIESNHVWKFQFDGDIDKNTIQNKVYILNEQKENVPVEVEVINNEILVKPPQEGYGKDKTYELFVEKDIKQVDGNNIEPIHFTFITKRDEVAKATYSKDLIKIKEKQIDKAEGNMITIKAPELKAEIKNGSILVIETGDKLFPEIARKVTSVKETGGKIVVDTDTPKFEELFDELDLYQEIPITPEHIELEPIEGLTLSNIPTGLTASVSPSRLLAEGKGKSYINFDNVTFKFNGNEVAINGKMDLNKGNALPDIVIKNKSIEKFHMYMELTSDTDVTVSAKLNTQEAKKTFKNVKDPNKNKQEKKWYIGTINAPTGIPGIKFVGSLYFVLEIGISGEPKVSIQYEITHRVGIKPNKGKWYQGYYDKDIKFKGAQVNGEGKVLAEAGPGADASLSAIGVMSAGLGFKGGGYAEGSIFQQDNDPIACGKIEGGGFGSVEAFVKAIPDPSSILQHVINKNKDVKYKYEISSKFAEGKLKLLDIDTCKIAKGLLSDPKEVALKPGEEKDISLALILHDKGTTKEETKKLGEDEKANLSVRPKQKDVVEAKVTKSGKIKLIAKELPAQKNTEVEVTYYDKKNDRKQTLTIPVSITEFTTTSLDQFTGYWRDENNKKLFVKIDKKSEKNIEFQAFDYVDIWYKGDVQFNAFKQNALSGKAKHLGGGEMDAPVEELKKAQDFTIEKVSENKIKVRLGDSVNNLKRSSKKEFEKEQAAIYEGLSTPDTQPNQKPDSQSNQSKKVDGTYEGTATQSDPNVKTEATFKQIDDKTATLVSSQWASRGEGVPPKYRGEIQTTAVKQNDSTWTFTWKDNNDSKGTGTITFQGENATLDLIGDISNPLDMGTISTKTQLKKKS